MLEMFALQMLVDKGFEKNSINNTFFKIEEHIHTVINHLKNNKAYDQLFIFISVYGYSSRG